MRDKLERCVLLPFSLGCVSESSVVVGRPPPHCHSKRFSSSSQPQYSPPGPYHITPTRNKQGREKDEEEDEEEEDDEDEDGHSLPRFQRLLKNFKNFSQLLLYKDDDEEIGDEELSIMGMEIGFPTDVKHVTHIGLDGGTGTGAATSIVSPTWRPPTATDDIFLFNHQNLLSSEDASPHAPAAVAVVAPGGTPP